MGSGLVREVHLHGGAGPKAEEEEGGGRQGVRVPHPAPPPPLRPSEVRSQTELLSALLTGEECDVRDLSGPSRDGEDARPRGSSLPVLPRDKRAFLCAPTNVGAANLYARCVASGWSPKEVSLVLAPEGASLRASTPRTRRRASSAAPSPRGGRQLDDQSLEILLVDEAAQCMGVAVGTAPRRVGWWSSRGRAAAPRPHVRGRESPPTRPLPHGELVVDLDYGNVVQLRVQHGMAPSCSPSQIEPSTTGCSAGCRPLRGSFEVVVEDACEEADGTSWLNRKTAAAAAAAAKEAKEGVEVEEEDKEEGDRWSFWPRGAVSPPARGEDG